MKLKRGTKPVDLNIPIDVSYTLTRQGDYIEIEISDVQEIARLRSMGFSNA